MIFSVDELGNSNDPHELAIEGGMLIDWDFSKTVNRDDEQSTAHQHAHTVS